MDIWTVLVALGRLMAIVAAIRKERGHFTARTKIVADIDGETVEFPFVTIRV